MYQSKITKFYKSSLENLEDTLYKNLTSIQNKLNFYINFEKIIEDINTNIKFYINIPDSKNHVLDPTYEDLEEYINLYEKTHNYKYSLDRAKFYNYIIELIDNNSGGMINRCLVCNIDMGECNPRQLCGKWKCDMEY